MPWPENTGSLDLLARVNSLGPQSVVVDWGCGMNHSPVSMQVRDLTCDLLVSVDAWAPYISFLAAVPFRAGCHALRISDIRSYLGYLTSQERTLSLSLCLDIVEHLEKEEAIQFLQGLKRISKNILVWIPLGPAPISHDTYGGDNHELHTHRSTWLAEDLEMEGFCCEVLEDFHTPMFGHKVDGCWALYSRNGEEGEQSADINSL